MFLATFITRQSDDIAVNCLARVQLLNECGVVLAYAWPSVEYICRIFSLPACRGARRQCERRVLCTATAFSSLCAFTLCVTELACIRRSLCINAAVSRILAERS